MNTLKPTLTFNCPENWSKMKIGLVSRYCDNCKRDVKDFTSLSKEEILQFLLTNRSNKVCGRIYPSQLDYHHEEILVTIDSYIQTNKNSNLSFYLLAVETLMMVGCSTMDSQKENKLVDSLSLAANGTHDLEIEKHHDPTCKIDSLLPAEFPIVGDLVIDASFRQDSSGARVLAKVMPEFVGGYDSLFAYISKHLKYPEWEKRERIEGNVFVKFVVDVDGKLKDPEILRSVPGSKNFDNEVLRLVKEMPAWKPGKEDGEDVAVQFVLPVGFRLRDK